MIIDRATLINTQLYHLERFERHYEFIAKPFEWKFTRDDLATLVQRLPPSLGIV